jgi:hypothetical protein
MPDALAIFAAIIREGEIPPRLASMACHPLEVATYIDKMEIMLFWLCFRTRKRNATRDQQQNKNVADGDIDV